MKLVECVPNFSEGRDQAVIDEITSQISQVEGATLLDVDPGPDTNRTVVTFVGTPEAVVEAAFRAIKRASELIDMRNHKGAHPRQGATDVCPLVPIADISVEECIELSHKLAKKVGDELGIPIYLYEKSATKPEWEQLSNIRVGEYEALEEKFKDEKWKPDYGPFKFNPQAGVTVIGVRDFLIAYNINLNTKDKSIAKDIGLTIRDTGRWKRDEDGKIERDEQGNKVRTPGTLNACKATGWYLPDFGLAQVTMNLIDYQTTGMHTAYEEVRRQAELRGVLVTGSEIVGLVPLKSLLDAGKFYLAKQGQTLGLNEQDILDMAIRSLGLSSLYEFKPEEKIIEYRVGAKAKGELASLEVHQFVDEVASDSVAPGGGSVSALLNSIGAGLTSMVCNITYGHKKFPQVKPDMEKIGVEAQQIKDRAVALIDKDTEAFNLIIAARRNPKSTDEEKQIREKAIEDATKKAAEVPLETCKTGWEALKLIKQAADLINPNSISDAGVGCLCAYAGVEGAYLNVLINIQSIEDSEFVEKVKKQADQYLQESKKFRDEILKISYKIIQEN
ncbi:MAG: formiminotransferase-cyclodeaminase [Desulfuromonas sp. SDB]|nr:MAG: formiminotransferase-cyclodeaminase [Desulfuromonas sp. SDB]